MALRKEIKDLKSTLRQREGNVGKLQEELEKQSNAAKKASDRLQLKWQNKQMDYVYLLQKHNKHIDEMKKIMENNKRLRSELEKPSE